MSKNLKLTLIVAGLVFLCAYLADIWCYSSSFPWGADSVGYLTMGKEISRGRLMLPIRHLDGVSVNEFGTSSHYPSAWTTRDDTGFARPGYPVGLPLHYAAVSKIFGWDHAVQILNSLLIVVSVVLIALLALELSLPIPLAFAASLLLLMNPLFAYAAVSPNSELSAGMWCLAALYGAIRGQRKAWWADVFAGLAFSISVLIRPTDLLLAPALFIATQWNLRRMVVMALGAVPGCLFQAWFNATMYGSPFSSNYGNISNMLRFQYVPHNVGHFINWIFMLIGPLALCAVALLFLKKKTDVKADNKKLVLALWIAAIYGFYAFYEAVDEAWWWSRFIFPTFPELILLSLCGLHTLGGRYAAFRFGALPKVGGYSLILYAAIVLSLFWETYEVLRGPPREIWHYRQGAQTYYEGVQWLEENAPHDAVVVTDTFSGTIYFYTDDFVVLHMNKTPPDKIEKFVQVVKERHQPFYGLLSNDEAKNNKDDVRNWKILSDAWQKNGGHIDVVQHFDDSHFAVKFSE